MRKLLWIFAPVFLVGGLLLYFASLIRMDVARYEQDLAHSYHFSGFLECKFPKDLNPDFKNIYSESCLISTRQEHDQYLNHLKPFLSKYVNSPLLRMRPFRPHNKLLSISTNLEYERLRDLVLDYSKTEQAKAQIITNFMESDCTPGKMAKYLEFAEGMQNQFTRMYVLSEIKNCMFINNLEDPGLIRTLLSLSPSEIEDESAGIIQLRDFLKDQSSLLRLLPSELSKITIDYFIPSATKRMLKDFDTFFYYDELSQLLYLKREYADALKYANLALDMNIKKYKVENFEIMNYLTIARLGKIYLQLGEHEKSKQVITQLDKENVIFKKLPDVYYIDFSLAELFLQSNDRRPALQYLEHSYQKKYIPEGLFKKWVSEINSTKTASLDLDMFRYVNKKSFEMKIYKNEVNQIILFKDKLEPVNQSMR